MYQKAFASRIHKVWMKIHEISDLYNVAPYERMVFEGGFWQALKYLKIGTCPASQKLLAYMEKMLIYIGNHPKFHLPCSLRHS